MALCREHTKSNIHVYGLVHTRRSYHGFILVKIDNLNLEHAVAQLEIADWEDGQIGTKSQDGGNLLF